jgi:hypothetical protein
MKSNNFNIDQFLDDAYKHGIAYSKGDYKVANKLHKSLHKFYKFNLENNRVEIFKQFLNHESENVRLWAAIFTLKFDSKAAEKTLEKLVLESNIRMTAEMTLKLWRQGKLDLI